MDIFLYIIFLLIGFLLGFLMHLQSKKAKQLMLDQKAEHQNMQIAELQTRLKEREEAIESLNNQLTNTKVDLAYLEKDKLNLLEKLNEQNEDLQNLQEKFTKEFENLANKILEEKSQKFSVQNKEQINQILEPLQHKIQTFEKKVEDTHKENIGQNSALRQQISDLKLMNEQMSKEALNLTKALKGDSKVQGNWGELILERVLEKSGLEKGTTYEVQQSFTNENGQRLQPDVIIQLPDNKQIVVDAKVSLVAYERYINEVDENVRQIALKEHVLSLKRHVGQLSEKKYHDIPSLKSLDFVLLFIPIETAFALALEHDPTLFSRAFEKNIVIVTPTTLLATLKTINALWTNQKQQENALEIARLAGSLYDKFEGFMQDLIKIGNKIIDAKKEYDASMNKLFDGRGNIIGTIEKLKTMGAKTQKSLPENVINRAMTDELE